MTPNEFIISKLQSFIHDFPETRVRYEHDKLSDTHFVEVVPNEVYYLSERYIAWESKMFDEFVDQFPHENIGFISDDALVGLENIDFELKGLHFDMPCISSTKSIIIEETNLEISSFVNSVTIHDITISTDINHHFSNNPINGLPDIGQFTNLPKAS
jgi:hypothetical protein